MFLYKITLVKKIANRYLISRHDTCCKCRCCLYTMFMTCRKLILSAILLKISKINLKIIYIQKIEKWTFWSKLPQGPFLRDAAHLYSCLHEDILYLNSLRLVRSQSVFSRHVQYCQIIWNDLYCYCDSMLQHAVWQNHVLRLDSELFMLNLWIVASKEFYVYFMFVSLVMIHKYS